jgi:hypothetical protein
MEAGLMVINSLPPQQQEEVLRAMFDAQQGAGFTAMKRPSPAPISCPRGRSTAMTRCPGTWR